MDGLTEGRIVKYVFVNGHQELVERPAIVVRVWNKDTGSANLQVFTDGSNDGTPFEKGIWWATSVTYSEDASRPYTWHWPARA